MSLANLLHTDVTHTAREPLDLHSWLNKASEINRLENNSLLPVALITGYLLAIAALMLTSISGGFPWFVVTLAAFAPLFALMAGDETAQ